METTSLPFLASYGSSAIDALGDDKITVTGGAVIVIGNSPAAVEVRGIARLTPDTLELEYRATRAQVLGFLSTPENMRAREFEVSTRMVIADAQWKRLGES